MCLGEVEGVCHIATVCDGEVLLAAELALQVGELCVREGGATSARLAALGVVVRMRSAQLCVRVRAQQQWQRVVVGGLESHSTL